MIPSFYVKRIMFKIEARLKQTNFEFRQSFPQEQWENFLNQSENTKGCELTLIGHFHPKEIIETRTSSTTGLVVPDWNQQPGYLLIKPDLEYKFELFTK